MSNRIDFFQSVQTQLAVPAAGVSVFFDGMLCPYLWPMEIVRGDWPEFSWARLSYNPTAYQQAELIAAEDIESVLAIGRSVCISQFYNGAAPGASAIELPVFIGQIETIESKIGPGGETVEVVARDFSAQFSRTTVYGQRIADSEGTVLFLAGIDTVFNEDGKPNAAIQPIENSGKNRVVFCAEPSEGKFWSYAEVIDYLLCEYLPDGQLQTPSIEQLQALTEKQIVRDFDVTGLSLLESLQRCCERIGLKFKFVPRLVSEDSGQAIVFYRAGAGRTVELNCQVSGERFSISKTNITALQSRKNFWPVTHKYVGQGDFKIYEATFDLVRGWPAVDEDTEYDKFSPSSNPDFYQVKDVFRKWCLNEAGDYTDVPYNEGAAFDFSRIFEGANFVCHRRRFWPALTADKLGESLGYFLQVSLDNGANWQQYLHSFNNLTDECGVWLSSDQLDNDIWTAAQAGLLRFRIIASVISDERLSCEIADGPVGSVAPVVEHIISLPRQFKYRKVSSRSIFANSSDESLGSPDEVDDSAALFEFIRQKANVSSETIETVNVQMPTIVFDYQPGDRLTSSPESRDLLGLRNDNRSISWIEKVQMDFEEQCTNLKIVRQRKAVL